MAYSERSDYMLKYLKKVFHSDTALARAQGITIGLIVAHLIKVVIGRF